MKEFKLKENEIKQLTTLQGECFASNEITVDGKQIGFMYKEETDDLYDTGWRFLSGEETQEYLDNPDNINIFDINTICNYDPDIIPFLNSPVGSAYEKNEEGKFVSTPFPEVEE